MTDENEDWYDADGSQNEYGHYDAGGHFYADRAMDAVDDYLDQLRDNTP